MGLPVSQEKTKQGIQAVSRMLTDHSKFTEDSVSYLLYIYSLYGNWHSNAFERLIQIKDANPYILSHLILSMVQSQNIKNLSKEQAQQIGIFIPLYKEKLKSWARSDEWGLFFPGNDRQKWGWPGDKTEISSYVLRALVKGGDNSSYIGQLAASLGKRRIGSAWSSTKETAHVFFALADYLENLKGDLKTSGNINLYLNNQKITSISYDLKKDEPGELVKKMNLTIPLDTIKSQEWKVNASGNASADLSYGITVKGNIYFEESGILSAFKNPQKELKELANGLDVMRMYYATQKIRDIKNSEYLTINKIQENTKVKVGDEILVKIKFIADQDYEFLVLEDYLPSGFEVTNMDAFQGALEYSHKERWDEKMVYFFNKLQKGKVYELGYLIRAELPGSFMIKPTRLECMYLPSIQGWSLPQRIQIH